MKSYKINIRGLGINHWQIITDKNDLEILMAVLKKIENQAKEIVIVNEGNETDTLEL